MEPIVSPWLIYLVMSIDKINAFLMVFGLGMVAAALIITVALDEDCGEKRTVIFRRFKRDVIIGLLLVLLGALLPSGKTLTAMYVASKLTPNNIHLAEGELAKVHSIVKQDVMDILTTVMKEQAQDQKPQEVEHE